MDGKPSEKVLTIKGSNFKDIFWYISNIINKSHLNVIMARTQNKKKSKMHFR